LLMNASHNKHELLNYYTIFICKRRIDERAEQLSTNAKTTNYTFFLFSNNE
jgi:hypothetical protein